MANRLARETSPYLLQHRDNPVDWYPWGAEATAAARDRDVPLLISVGYSACHWCHVMERESFEDEETAAFMNEHFVCVKVDREERPDVDALYMEAVQEISGQGGWPMTVFCDPDGVPFYGGTYFPPDDSRGMPSFRMVMEAVVEAFENRRDELRERAPRVRERLGAVARVEPSPDQPGPELLETAVETLLSYADTVNGGFGGAPKFPPASSLELLLARGETAHVERTLDAMMAGGIHDQLGGGFSRYSVDGAWAVPHFEKMLYDNALLATAYLHGWQALGHERHRRVCESTLEWMLREMRGPEGGFHSALDADSEGEEGRYYVWTAAEIRDALIGSSPPSPGDRSNTFSISEMENVLEYFGVTEAGNFEGSNVLHLARGASAEITPEIERAREALLAAREGRVRPGLDDKRLAAWNALAISALAEAGAALDRADFLAAAIECAEFVLTEMRDGDGRLLRTYKDGRAHLNAYLEDHAFLLEALLTLYEATFDRHWYEEAEGLAATMIARFGDDERGGFFSTSDDHEELIARRKEVGDHPIPSGNSAAALGLLRLAALGGDGGHEESAAGVLRLFAGAAVGRPDGFAHMLRALDLHVEGARQVALIGDEDGRLAAAVRAGYRPRLALASGAEGSAVPALLASRSRVENRPTGYVCRQFACQLPVTDAHDLIASL